MDIGSRILVVDDDPIYVKSTAAILKSYGYQVETAQSGQEGLSRIRASAPDLVLLDVMMSWVLDGVELSEVLMYERDLSSIPIIMISSIRNSEYRGLFPQDRYLHIDSWLDKPCAPSELVTTIQSTLARRERYRAQAKPS